MRRTTRSCWLGWVIRTDSSASRIDRLISLGCGSSSTRMSACSRRKAATLETRTWPAIASAQVIRTAPGARVSRPPTVQTKTLPPSSSPPRRSRSSNGRGQSFQGRNSTKGKLTRREIAPKSVKMASPSLIMLPKSSAGMAISGDSTKAGPFSSVRMSDRACSKSKAYARKEVVKQSRGRRSSPLRTPAPTSGISSMLELPPRCGSSRYEALSATLEGLKCYLKKSATSVAFSNNPYPCNCRVSATMSAISLVTDTMPVRLFREDDAQGRRWPAGLRRFGLMPTTASPIPCISPSKSKPLDVARLLRHDVGMRRGSRRTP